MPTYTAARSDDARLSTLETISTTAALDNDDARLLPAALRQRVDAFLPGYRPVVQAVEAAMAGRAKEVSEKDKALKSLTTHVQDFFEVLKRRTARLGHDVSALVHYGLPQAGDVPKLVAEAAIETAADGIVKGEVAAVAAGFPAMLNPSATEVKAALDSYRKESGEVVPADALVRQACGPVRWVEVMQALRARGLNHIVECGPGKVLAGLARRFDSEVVAGAVYDPATLAQTRELLS